MLGNTWISAPLTAGGLFIGRYFVHSRFIPSKSNLHSPNMNRVQEPLQTQEGSVKMISHFGNLFPQETTQFGVTLDVPFCNSGNLLSPCFRWQSPLEECPRRKLSSRGVTIITIFSSQIMENSVSSQEVLCMSSSEWRRLGCPHAYRLLPLISHQNIGWETDFEQISSNQALYVLQSFLCDFNHIFTRLCALRNSQKYTFCNRGHPFKYISWKTLLNLSNR